MDLITSKVIDILLTQVIGKAVNQISELGSKILKLLSDQFQNDDKASEHLNDFLNDPETFQRPLEKDIDTALKSSPQFKQSITALLANYESSPTSSMTASALGSGQNRIAQVQGRDNIVGDKNIGGDYIDRQSTKITAQSIGNITFFGIPIPVFCLVGAGLMLFGFFAMPWVNMFITFSGFELATQVSNSSFATGSASLQMLTLWIIPAVAVIAGLIAISNLSNPQSKPDKGVYTLIILGGIASLYPFFYVYSDISGGLNTLGMGGLNIIAQGFWIALAGSVILLVSSIILISNTTS